MGLLFLILFGGLFLYCAACEAAVIIDYIGHWKVFKKAGFEGWECLIPIYNSFVLYKSVWGSGWFFLLGFIPVGGIIAGMVTYFQLGKRFGKSTGFCIGLMLIPWLFVFILGLQKDRVVKRNVQFEDGSFGTIDEIQSGPLYQGPGKNGRTGMILGSSIVGFFSIIVSIITAIALAVAIAGIAGNIGKYLFHNDYNTSAPISNDGGSMGDLWEGINWEDSDAAQDQIEDILENMFGEDIIENGIDNVF